MRRRARRLLYRAHLLISPRFRRAERERAERLFAPVSLLLFGAVLADVLQHPEGTKATANALADLLRPVTDAAGARGPYVDETGRYRGPYDDPRGTA